MSSPFFMSDFVVLSVQPINEYPKSVFETQYEIFARIFRFSKFTELFRVML